MLSYQHAYHAGNAADVHKHALLCCTLDYMVRKDKPLTYMETHAGRGLYDLGSKEATKTGEAAQGVARMLERFAPDHPYRKTIGHIRADHGPDSYPGSPLIAHSFQRSGDRLQLTELHPQEHAALVDSLPTSGVHIYNEDGFPWAARLCPPTPRRGLMLIDPSYELAHDFSGIPDFLAGLHHLWPVGVIMLWYPVLASGAHNEMADALDKMPFGKVLHHRVMFKAAKQGHGLVGSGLFVINPPYTLEMEAEVVEAAITGA